jgi:Tol biopolymer transport system component
MTFAASLCQAEIQGEVIAASNGFLGRVGVMPANSNLPFLYISCSWPPYDLTHNGPPRYWLATPNGTSVLPNGWNINELAASDEDCQQTITLFTSPNMRFGAARWSHDGNRIAAGAWVWDLDTGEIAEEGIYVADVLRDGTGRPVGIANLALLIRTYAASMISWSGDDQRIAYQVSAPRSGGGTQIDIWVRDIPSGVETNITNSPDYSEDSPAYSPVAERIAFRREVPARNGEYRYDIYTMPAFGGAATRITTPTTPGGTHNEIPSYSPDGQYLLFVSSDGSFERDRDLYRIKSDGSGKATNLTGKQKGFFGINRWRR